MLNRITFAGNKRKISMMIVYRLLTFIVGFIAATTAIAIVGSLPAVVSSPMLLFPAFLLACVTLYGWFSIRFGRQVLQLHQQVPWKLRDWVRVNGIVVLILSVLLLLEAIVVLRHPSLLEPSLKSFDPNADITRIKPMMYVMIFYSGVLLVHVLWTFSLLQKYRSYFIRP